MADNVNRNEEDVIVKIHLRNAFYRKKYYFILGLYLLSFIVIATLIGMLVYLKTHPLHPYYFVADDAGRFVQEIPLQQPNMTDQDVANWAKEAVEAAYTYDYINYRSQLQNAQKYFTDYGWRNYMQALQDSLNLVAVTQRKLVTVAKVVGQPTLDTEGPLGKAGILAYKFDMQLLLTYTRPPYDDNFKNQNALQVSVIIERQDALSSYRGLGIVQLISSSPPPG